MGSVIRACRLQNNKNVIKSGMVQNRNSDTEPGKGWSLEKN